MKIWRGHFCGLLNQPNSIDWPTVEALAQREMKDSFAREPSLSEVQKALGQLRNGKTPEEDNVQNFSSMGAWL